MLTQEMAGHLIRRLYQQSTLVFMQKTEAAGFDLTPVQWAALDTIHANPGTDQAGVAELIGYDRATIGGVIDRLVKKGWVRRVVSVQDRRARELSLTALGTGARTALLPIVQALQADILQPLSEADQARFVALASEVVRASRPGIVPGES